MKKTKLLNTSVVDNTGARIQPSVVIGEYNGHVSGDILDANATSSLIDEKIERIDIEALNTLQEDVDSIKEVLGTDSEDLTDTIDTFNEIQQFLSGVDNTTTLNQILNGKINNPSNGSVGQVLTKTANGVAWEDTTGASVVWAGSMSSVEDELVYSIPDHTYSELMTILNAGKEVLLHIPNVGYYRSGYSLFSVYFANITYGYVQDSQFALQVLRVTEGSGGSIALEAVYINITDIEEDVATLEDLVANKQDKLITGLNIKTINNQSLLGSGNLVVTAGNAAMVNHGTSDTTFAVTSNVLHVWGEVASLSLTLATPTDNTIVNEYMFQFTSGATATTLSLPSTITWVATPNIQADKTYQISIIN